MVNIYCDESGHLPRDHQPNMVLGAVWCPQEKVRESAKRIREIKRKHGMSADFELKWTKVSPAKVDLYKDVLDYFFDDGDLNFRAVIANKRGLDHDAFGQDHDTWYYKMYFLLLGQLLDPRHAYEIYLDIKDTRSQQKIENLHDVLCNDLYDFDHKIIRQIQQVRSHEVQQIQLADLLVGGIAAANRGIEVSGAKALLLNRIRERTHYALTKTTLQSERKFNLFRWTPQVTR